MYVKGVLIDTCQLLSVIECSITMVTFPFN